MQQKAYRGQSVKSVTYNFYKKIIFEFSDLVYHKILILLKKLFYYELQHYFKLDVIFDILLSKRSIQTNN